MTVSQFATRNDGTAPVMGRIAADGTQTPFGCKGSIVLKIRDTESGREQTKKEDDPGIAASRIILLFRASGTYSFEMAPTGHTPAQVPHSVQVFGSIL